MNITTEQGKTLKDAQGDVFRGLGLSYVCYILLHAIIKSTSKEKMEKNMLDKGPESDLRK